MTMKTTCITTLAALALTGTAIAQEQIAQQKKTIAEFNARQFSFQTIGDGLGAQSKLVTGAPYSAEEKSVMTQVLSDGNRIVKTTSATLYRDQQGRTRVEPLTDSDSTVIVNDPVAATHFVLDPKNHTVMKGGNAQMTEARRMLEVQVKQLAEMRAGGGSATAFKITRTDGSAEKSSVEQLDKRVMEGLAVEGTRTTVTIPAGQIGNEGPIHIVSERWYSPDLQMVIMSKRSDPRMGETVYTLSNIKRANPDASLFQIPAGYTETQSMEHGMAPRAVYHEE